MNNYIAAVRRHLPERMRDDVGEELHSTLSDSIDSMEQATGRPLSDDEVADLLKRRGHPLLVASAYRGDRGLVGAQLFPIYLRILKGVLAIIAALVLADYLFGYGAAQYRDFPVLLYRFYTLALQAFAWVTIGFYAAESWMERTQFMQRWSPRNLPTVVGDERSAPAVRGGLLSIAALVLTGKFLIHGATLSGQLLQRSEPISLGLSAGWLGLGQWFAAGLCIAAVTMAIVTLCQGYWNRGLLIACIALNLLLALALLGVVVDPWSVALTPRGGERAIDVASLVLLPKIFIGVVALTALTNTIRQIQLLRKSGIKIARRDSSAVA
ncbi:hypothetical protein [Xanthomonas bonasiae]|uniref:hypothetical protein n=1 Tax=Xanthomonas bonasiae TaxID=2810351 RepID=UPI001981BD3B|nr:hypothetical protein [Xanthomonas bonasiae]MBN6113187.1 hypothetical protein [Xanthomonas bonasiae]